MRQKLEHGAGQLALGRRHTGGHPGKNSQSRIPEPHDCRRSQGGELTCHPRDPEHHFPCKGQCWRRATEWAVSSGAPLPAHPPPGEEGVVWSHAPPWKPGSLSKAVTPPPGPQTPQDPALLALEPSRGQVICGCPGLASDTHPGAWSGRSRGRGAVGPGGVRVACVPSAQENAAAEIRMMT